MAKNLTRNQEAYQALLKQYTKPLIADFAGVTKQAVQNWDSIPPKHAQAISAGTGLAVEKLLPDPCEDCQNPFCKKKQT